MTSTGHDNAVSTPTRYADVPGRRLAYRTVGDGRPILLCTRFRGDLDQWDPAFLDALVGNGQRVITFDYSGLGLSTGTRSYNPFDLARDATDLLKALDLTDVVLGGWSLGGIAAQCALATASPRITSAILIGTVPPGPVVKQAEPLFFETAAHPVNDLEDQITLFFEPRSQTSREAARLSAERIARRTTDRSNPVPAEWAASTISGPSPNPFPAPHILAFLETTTIPILHIGGDHDIVFPVENWYALNRRLPTLQLLTYPRAGHGPQHQHPQATADHISIFLRDSALQN